MSDSSQPPNQRSSTHDAELAKRAADRYNTASDLAEDLRHWQAKRKKGVRRQALGDRGGVRKQGTGASGGEEGRRGRGETNPEAAA